MPRHERSVDGLSFATSEQKISVAAVLVAAGKSERMGTQISKQFYPLCGQPVLAYALKALEACPCIHQSVLVCRPDEREEALALIQQYHIRKFSAAVFGGDTRQRSVYNGVQACVGATHVAVHDAARALITPELIDQVVHDGIRYGASTLAGPVKDTIKQADPSGFVQTTLDRSCLWNIQTPQVFFKPWYLEAFAKAGKACFTDDCQLLEQSGHPVHLCMGSYENFKLTTLEDLPLAERILTKRKEEQA